MSKYKKSSKEKRTNLDLVTPYVKDYTFVLDYSVVVIYEIYELFEKIIESSGNIIILSSTVDELERCEKSTYIPSSYNSKRILDMAKIYEGSFTIDKSYEGSFLSSDEQIIQYCSTNKEKIVLITYSKKMYINSLKKGIITILLDNPPLFGVIRTLNDAKPCDSGLCITNIESPYKMVHTFSNDIEVSSGDCNLNIGDDVFVIVKKNGYMVFMHFRIINLNVTSNSVLKYHRRFDPSYDLNRLPNGNYKSFIKNFIKLNNF